MVDEHTHIRRNGECRLAAPQTHPCGPSRAVAQSPDSAARHSTRVADNSESADLPHLRVDEFFPLRKRFVFYCRLLWISEVRGWVPRVIATNRGWTATAQAEPLSIGLVSTMWNGLSAICEARSPRGGGP